MAATLDMLAADPALANNIRTDQVAALGFFLGGTAVLGLGGARLDADSFGQSCDENGTGLDCAWFAAHGVDLRDVDSTQLTRSNIDPRIKLVVAVDPELSAHVTSESLASVDIPVTLINLGDAETRTPGLDASGLAAAFPDMHYIVVSDATPFSAFSRCKPNASSILAEDGEDDAICRESGDRTRDDIHAELALIIADTLEHAFPTEP